MIRIRVATADDAEAVELGHNNLIRRPNHLADYKPNPNIAIVNGFMCADTDEEALEKAAGWTFAGQTTGRTRQDRDRTIQAPVKSVWLLPLHPRFRAHLTAP